MKVELTVTVEIPDAAASLLDSGHMGGAAGLVRNIVLGALRGQDGFSKVLVDVLDGPEGSESDGDATEAASTVHTPKRHAPAVSVPRTASQDSSGRTGRPKTLHNLAASDGEPVREWGQRSPEALAEAGIEVWEVETDAPPQSPAKRALAEARQSTPTGQRAKPVQMAQRVKVRGR